MFLNYVNSLILYEAFNKSALILLNGFIFIFLASERLALPD